MKTVLFSLMVMILMIFSMPVLAQNKDKSPLQDISKPQKILIAYFSYSGNTQVIADFIRKGTGGDLFEIQPVKKYSKDYDTVVAQAKQELKADYKPELKSKVENITDYDVIFVGSPNWWATVAPPVMTFLTIHNLSGKKIIPFITHEGSRMGKSVDDIKKLCTKSIVLEGLPVRGSAVNAAQGEVNVWLGKLRFLK